MLNTRFMLHELRDAIRGVGADLVFLQEVQGEHRDKAQRESHWPELAQYEFLADQVWNDFAYGKNAAYQAGHHGNAVLSHYPIARARQVDISTNRVEQRGFLFCEIDLKPVGTLYGLCIHLGLTAVSRRKQLQKIGRYIRANVPANAPLVIAGDTNDWSGVPTAKFAENLGLKDAFEVACGHRARTFPSFAPILGLDRIYVRGLQVTYADCFSGGKWSELSDHAALLADVELTESAFSASP